MMYNAFVENKNLPMWKEDFLFGADIRDLLQLEADIKRYAFGSTFIIKKYLMMIVVGHIELDIASIC